MGSRPDSPSAARVLPSPNHGERRPGRDGAPRRPDILLLHYTGMEGAEAALARLRDPRTELSAHYVVLEDGEVLQLVPEVRRAHHAGVAAWGDARGMERDVNSASIGVEVVNGGHAHGLPPYPAAQVAGVIALARDVLARWRIPAARVLAHSDVAPERKEDPGEHFPWGALAAAGVGHWVAPARVADGRFLAPGEVGQPVEALQAMLALVGYDVPVTGTYDPRTEAVVRAFQRHYRPARPDGIADAGTITTLRDLLATRPAA